MNIREEALKEPGRPESLVFAMLYVGDMLAEVLAAVEHLALRQDMPDNLKQPAKAAQTEVPRPKGASGPTGKVKPDTKHLPGDGSEDHDFSADQSGSNK